MSGTLQVARDSVWMPQSRVFDAVVTEIAAELSYDDLAADDRLAGDPGSATSELAAMLLAGRTVHGTGHIDLADAQPSAIERIRRATRDVVLREVAAGDSGRFGADWFLRSVDAASLLGGHAGSRSEVGRRRTGVGDAADRIVRSHLACARVGCRVRARAPRCSTSDRPPFGVCRAARQSSGSPRPRWGRRTRCPPPCGRRRCRSGDPRATSSRCRLRRLRTGALRRPRRGPRRSHPHPR